MKRPEKVAKSIVPVATIPAVTMAPIGPSRRIVGGKRYCAVHGVAHLESYAGQCPRCVNEKKPPQHYENFVLVSRTEARPSRSGDGTGSWDGKNGRPFIGEVVSIHIIDSKENIALKKAALRKKHGY